MTKANALNAAVADIIAATGGEVGIDRIKASAKELGGAEFKALTDAYGTLYLVVAFDDDSIAMFTV